MNSRLIIACVVLLTLLATSGRLAYNKIRTLTTERDQAIAFANSTGEQAQAKELIYLNQNGHLVTRNKVLILDLDNARKLLVNEHTKYLRELKGVKPNLKNLDETMTVDAMVDIADMQLHVYDTVYMHAGDTIRLRKFGYVDEFNSLKGTLEGDTSVLINAGVKVPLRGAVYWQRRRIIGLRIGKKDFSSEFTTPNPWVKITGTEIIKIQKR